MTPKVVLKSEPEFPSVKNSQEQAPGEFNPRGFLNEENFGMMISKLKLYKKILKKVQVMAGRNGAMDSIW